MSKKWRREMVSMKSEEAVSTNGIVGSYTDMLGIDAKGNSDWIKAGSGDDQVDARTTQTLADAVAAQELAVASGRSDLLLDGGSGDDSVFGGAGRAVIFSDGESGRRFADADAEFKWVAGDNVSGSSVYFNGAPKLGIPYASDRQYEGNYFGVESADFTPLDAFAGAPLAATDYLAGWTVSADGKFDGTASQVYAPDPQSALRDAANESSLAIRRKV